MIKSKRLIEMARKWHRTASLGRRRRISLGARARAVAAIANEGHFVVYTVDGKRFVVPLAYLGSPIFKRLLRMSEEEFGFPGSGGVNGRITLPYDAAVMNYVLLLMERRVSRDVEGALLVSIAAGRCSASCLPSSQQGQLLLGQQISCCGH
ncbi:hypothetical protein QJS10_CPA01g00301 [Acorus calamus]|uniref:Uncharacterized protein n=1 Tax=Acorus calamus TaxID=4465 RepID=A0AAV9FGR9_ACOCL|nr:hypothetical protein QJS10_CPA01g00301 [Acorus calamus]